MREKLWNRWCNNASLSDGVELVGTAILTMVHIATRPDKYAAIRQNNPP
ncbi:hypothetical protein KCP76_16080 [Salmonella enterica subsp. enterica serovar Weltevreden]|nr:hypothetical protein KCP76_16080 [Salmonella enterica subsp. enterica serovar Weltevreden]